ncbi:hypothetical protein HDU78_002362 [Chytriomyces hyalinus]|nr:hypothetical protein HDU78_002362 [Chytriomyces hyalinus]
MDVDVVQAKLPKLDGGLKSLLALDNLNQQQVQILSLLELYFSDKEIPSLLARLVSSHKGEAYPPQHGWVPLSSLVDMKSFKAIHASVNDVGSFVTSLSNAFEISPDSRCIRRTASFDQSSVAASLLHSTNLSASCVQFLRIGADAVELDFVAYIANKFGEVGRSHFNHEVDSKSCFIQFKDAQVMVKLLATSNSTVHTYEDATLTVQSAQFPSLMATAATAKAVDFNYPSLTSSNGRTKPIKQMGQTAIQAAQILGYPLNRIIRFGPVDTDASSGFTASSVQALAKTEFSKLALVADCAFRDGETFGFVRFKKPVALELAEMLMRHGGVDLVGAGKIKVQALEGEDERFYHEIAKEKERINAPAVDAVIALNATKTVKARRNLAAKLQGSSRRKQLTPAEAHKLRKRTAISQKAASQFKAEGSKKRMAVDLDEDMGAADDKPAEQSAAVAPRVIMTRSKKAKMDDLEDLVKGMSTFN